MILKRRRRAAALQIAVFILLSACHHDSSPTAPPLNAASLTGKVTNAVTAAPVDRVEVSVTQSGQTIATLTSSAGTYSFFTGLLSGNVTVTAKAAGFATFTATTTVATGSNRYDIQLRPAP